MEKVYDLIILGAGPAGLSASIYASRYGLGHLVIGEQPGGTIMWAHKVENYLGLFSLSGAELAEKFVEHAKKLGANILTKKVTGVKKETRKKKEQRKEGEVFEVTTSDGGSYYAKAVILAMGTKRRQLGVVGEKDFVGKGVSYCSTCDAALFKNKVVVVVGGADAACSGAVHLAEFAKKVFLLYRRNTLRAEPAWIKEVEAKKNIEILYETNIVEIKGQKKVEKIIIDKEYERSKELAVDGVFIEIGGIPVFKLARDLGVSIDEAGYIVTDKDMSTNVLGLFCAGDINSFWKNFQQVITAVAEGAVASYSAYEYLKSNT